jgi:hypothetical protein
VVLPPPLHTSAVAGSDTDAEVKTHLVAKVKEADRKTAEDDGKMHPVRPLADQLDTLASWVLEPPEAGTDV